MSSEQEVAPPLHRGKVNRKSIFTGSAEEDVDGNGRKASTSLGSGKHFLTVLNVAVTKWIQTWARVK